MSEAKTYNNVRIWDGIANDYVDATSITIESGRIASLGQSSRTGRDCSGLTVIPGLIDSHVHMTLDPQIADVDKQLKQSDDEIRQKMPKRAKEMVHAGITSARDLGGGNWLELELRDQINRGELPGPRLMCAGRPITSIDGHCHFWGGAVKSVEEGCDIVDQNRMHNVDLIKIMATGGVYTTTTNTGDAQFTKAEFKEMIAYAHANDYQVAAHCHGAEGIERVVAAGVDTVEHCSWMNEKGQRGDYRHEVALAMARQNTWVSPTVNANWARFLRINQAHLGMVRHQFREMKSVGVRFIASTDAGIPHVRHDDLPKALPVFALYADMSPIEVLKSATSDAALALNINHRTGTISPGLDADLVFVEGDPLQDLKVLQSPTTVVARGIEYSR
ncbi:MAG: amidohydrolase family protein [Gammaproteobacteria bacterium]|nr:amidohydrolase family protein [Gammaproteobacteria bacterium]